MKIEHQTVQSSAMGGPSTFEMPRSAAAQVDADGGETLPRVKEILTVLVSTT